MLTEGGKKKKHEGRAEYFSLGRNIRPDGISFLQGGVFVVWFVCALRFCGRLSGDTPGFEISALQEIQKLGSGYHVNTAGQR